METCDNSISLKAEQIYEQVLCKLNVFKYLQIPHGFAKYNTSKDFKSFFIFLKRKAKQIVANGAVLSDRNICS